MNNQELLQATAGVGLGCEKFQGCYRGLIKGSRQSLWHLCTIGSSLSVLLQDHHSEGQITTREYDNLCRYR